MSLHESEVPKFKPGKASESSVRLSQAILGPLDALFKAQVHAARSFLNLILQLGTKHEDYQNPKNNEPSHYNQEFLFETHGADSQIMHNKISIPALALVPIAPLSIESAEFKLELNISHVAEHQQYQEEREKKVKESSGKTKAPWYLVEEPISILGTFAPMNDPADGTTTQKQQSSVQVSVKLSRIPIPQGLDKLLTTFSQSATVTEVKPSVGTKS